MRLHIHTTRDHYSAGIGEASQLLLHMGNYRQEQQLPEFLIPQAFPARILLSDPSSGGLTSEPWLSPAAAPTLWR